MQAGWSRRNILLGMGASLVTPPTCGSLNAQSVAPENQCRGAPLNGTFLQPLDSMRDQSVAEWIEHLKKLKEFGMDAVYLQWLELDGIDFVDDGPGQTRLGAFFGPLLAAAERVGSKVHCGLSANLRAANTVYGSPEKTDEFLRGQRQRSLALAHRIDRVARSSPAFAGWYLPEELDDLTVSDAARARLWIEHLQTMGQKLKELSPTQEISASCYVTGRVDPVSFMSVWISVWAKAKVTLMLQDGFGTAALAPGVIKSYMTAIQSGASACGASWCTVIELFQQVAGEPINSGTFKATPATPDRIAQQISLAMEFPTTRRIAFTATDYLFSNDDSSNSSLSEYYRSRFCARAMSNRA